MNPFKSIVLGTLFCLTIMILLPSVESTVVINDTCLAYCNDYNRYRPQFSCSNPYPYCCGYTNAKVCCNNEKYRLRNQRPVTDPHYCDITWWNFHWRVMMALFAALLLLVLVGAVCYCCCDDRGRSRVGTRAFGVRRNRSRGNVRNGDIDTVTSRVDRRRSRDNGPQSGTTNFSLTLEPPAYDSLPKDPPAYQDIIGETSQQRSPETNPTVPGTNQGVVQQTNPNGEVPTNENPPPYTENVSQTNSAQPSINGNSNDINAPISDVNRINVTQPRQQPINEQGGASTAAALSAVHVDIPSVAVNSSSDQNTIGNSCNAQPAEGLSTVHLAINENYSGVHLVMDQSTPGSVSVQPALATHSPSGNATHASSQVPRQQPISATNSQSGHVNQAFITDSQTQTRNAATN